ncbi:hypothetical protein MLD38_015899 [Melastoma candidum]|uniref:Uncharacterized protein n=1 Tax=Melastoma candidum TaxID=119954 RepID=A0ACB9RHU2_9MYRT|nr:hypothetical protein MLD38_015899 [Melastoma candidum]
MSLLKIHSLNFQLDSDYLIMLWLLDVLQLESQEMGENAYAEVVIGADEVAVAASPSGTAHALKKAHNVPCFNLTRPRGPW